MTYNIGFVTKPIEIILHNGPGAFDIVWLKHKYKDRFFADPFLLDEDDKYFYVVCEEYLFFEEKGKITLLTVDKKTYKLVNRKVIIEESTHLSFPYCKFKEYIIYPESSESGAYWKYVIDKDTLKIVSKTKIINEPLIDCVHFKDNESVWLYGSLPPSPNFNLFSFRMGTSSEKNCVFENNNCISRGAGDFFASNGVIFKPVQNCVKRYGNFVEIMKMTKIGDRGFQMEKIVSVNSFENPPFWQTCHTFNVYKDIIIVDGSYDFFRFPMKFFYKKLPFLFKRRLKK